MPVVLFSTGHSWAPLIGFDDEAAEGSVGLAVWVLVEASLLQLQVDQVALVQQEEGRVGALLVVALPAIGCHLVLAVLHQGQPGEDGAVRHSHGVSIWGMQNHIQNHGDMSYGAKP